MASARGNVELADALAAVRARLARAAEAAGRNADEIELLPDYEILSGNRCAYFVAFRVCCIWRIARTGSGRTKVAEVQFRAERRSPIRWHMVGRIQRNKARSIAGWAYAAHSVDSAKLIAALDRACDRGAGRRRPDRAAAGLPPDQPRRRQSSAAGWTSAVRISVDELCAAGAAADGLEFVGLMGIPPLDADPGRSLRAAAGRAASGYRRPTSSASGCRRGCPATSRAAVKHGSTCVRVGTALLGQRPLTSP